MAQRYGKFIAAWNPYITYPKTFSMAFGTWLLACRSITTLCSMEFIITSPVVLVVLGSGCFRLGVTGRVLVVDLLLRLDKFANYAKQGV